MIANKPELEQLLIKVSNGSDVLEESSGTGSSVDKSTHQLGQKYCVECKNSFKTKQADLESNGNSTEVNVL